MPSLLSGSKLRTGGSGEFIKLANAMPQLPQSPSLSTGYTLVTDSLLQSYYTSSLGNIQFYAGQMYSNISTQTLTLIGTGTTAVVIQADNPLSSTSTLVVKGGASIFGSLLVNGTFQSNTGTLQTLNLTSTATSSNTTTGALQVAGGIGVGGNVNVGGILDVLNSSTFAQSVVMSGSLTANGNGGDVILSPQAADVTIEPTLGGRIIMQPSATGSIENMTIGYYVPQDGYFQTVHAANATVTNNVYVGGTATVAGNVVVSGGVAITQTSTVAGAQIITTATLNNYVNQPVVSAGTDTAVSSYISSATEYITVWDTSTLQSVTSRGNTTSNPVHITNKTDSANTTTGALIVDGGLGVGQDMWLGGVLYSNGVPVITTSSLIQQILSGPDILVTSTQGYTTGSIVVTISDTSTFQTVTTRGNTTNQQVFFTNTTESTSSSTGAVVISGGLGVAKRINAESVQIADTIIDSGNVLVNNTSTTVIDSYPITQYRSAKYLIQITDGTGPSAGFETIEILLLVDNNQTVYATEYALLTSNGELGEFAADVQNDNMVRLYFTAYQASSKVIKIFRTGMTV